MSRIATLLIALLTATTNSVLAQSDDSLPRNSTTSIPTSLATAGVGTNPPTTTVEGSTGVAFFTINAVSYGATAASGDVVIAGYTLSPGGPGALVGGEEVSAVSNGIVFGGQTAPFSQVMAATTSSNTAAGTTMATSSTPMSTSSVSAATTAASSSSTSSGGAAAQATRMPVAMAAFGGIAGVIALL